MVSSMTLTLKLLLFLSVALREPGTIHALLGLWPNNTEVYLTPFICTQNPTVSGYKDFYSSISL